VRLLCALGALLMTGLLGCSDAPSKADCEKLLDHLIEVEIKQGGGDAEMSADMKDDLDKQKKAVVEYASGQKFIETCTQKTPKSVVECGLAAKDACDLQACDSKMSDDEMASCKKDLKGDSK
jgi:hypothetical protein